MKLDGILRYEKTVYVSEADLELRYLMYSFREQGRTIYCLSVTLTDDAQGQECLLYDVATSLSMADRIWGLFTEGLVTPVTAQDILEELLSDRDFLYAD